MTRSPTFRVAGPAARRHARALTAGTALVLLRTGAVLLRPWPLALAVDHALSDQPAGEPMTILVLAGLATAALSGVLGLLDMVAERATEGAAERIGADLRAEVFDTAMTRSLRWHDRIRSGELLSRLTTDVGRLLDGVVAVTTTLVPDTVMVVIVLVLLTAIDPWLALVGVSVVPLLAVLAARQRRRVRVAQTDARAESGRLVTTTGDLFRNIRAVQAFGRADRAATVFGTRNRALLAVELRAVDVTARWAPVADLVLATGSALVLGVGGAHVLAGTLSTGQLLVALAYLRDLYGPVRGLTRLSTVLAKSADSASRVSEVLDCPDAVTDVPGALAPPPLVHGVRFEQVGFGFEPGRPVLRGLDLTVEAGRTTCLYGPSGVGKSTLLHLLLRLYDVDAGRILWEGTDLRALRQAGLRERISYLPQDPWLLDATLAENIAFGNRRATRAEVLNAGRAALVDEFAGVLPFGYDTVLGEGGVRLSGGQRRRVALARAAVSRAPLVLLDEPTASLDRDSAAAVARAIRRTTAGRTVLIVTHDRDLVALADRVLELGVHAENRTREGVTMR